MGARSSAGRCSRPAVRWGHAPRWSCVAARAPGPWQLAVAAERHRPPRVPSHLEDLRKRSFWKAALLRAPYPASVC